VSEKIGLEQLFRYGGAIQGDEWALSPQGIVVVNGAGDGLLAGAALSQNEDVDRQTEHALDAVSHFGKSSVPTNDIGIRCSAFYWHLSQIRRFPRTCGDFNHS
jgi:hypothetical protein